MANFIRKNVDREANSFGDNLVYAGLITVLVYGLAIADRDAGLVASALGFWIFFYLLYAPLLVRRVAIREPSGDTWRAAAFVAYGAAPFGLFVPFWSELTAWPASIAAYPLVAIWSSTALVLAVLERPRIQAARPRALFLGLAGAIFAIAAGPMYLGFIIGLFTGRWAPPDGETVVVGLALFGGLPWAAGSAYAAIELLGRANRPVLEEV